MLHAVFQFSLFLIPISNGVCLSLQEQILWCYSHCRGHVLSSLKWHFVFFLPLKLLSQFLQCFGWSVKTPVSLLISAFWLICGNSLVSWSLCFGGSVTAPLVPVSLLISVSWLICDDPLSPASVMSSCLLHLSWPVSVEQGVSNFVPEIRPTD